MSNDISLFVSQSSPSTGMPGATIAGLTKVTVIALTAVSYLTSPTSLLVFPLSETAPLQSTIIAVVRFGSAVRTITTTSTSFYVTGSTFAFFTTKKQTKFLLNSEKKKTVIIILNISRYMRQHQKSFGLKTLDYVK